MKQFSWYADITLGTTNDGNYSWTVPYSYENSDVYQIRIYESSDYSIYDISGNFDIYNDSITVSNPPYGIIWKTNSNYTIEWDSTGDITFVDIKLYESGSWYANINLGTNNNTLFRFFCRVNDVKHLSKNVSIRAQSPFIWVIRFRNRGSNLVFARNMMRICPTILDM